MSEELSAKKEIMTIYSISLLGRPYIWGGDDPVRGFDCSGLVQEILASGGFDPRSDQTAQGLYDILSRDHKLLTKKEDIQTCSLVFFGKSSSEISHVGFAVNKWQMVEAGGGGSRTLTEDDAIKQNAYVRIRPISARFDFVAAIDLY